MGVYLSNVETEDVFGLSIWGWPMVLALAKQYGWEPSGTESPLEKFTAQDVKAMADALEKALIDVYGCSKPEKHEINEAIANDRDLNQLRQVMGTGFQDLFNRMARTSPRVFFSLDGGERLVSFIDFCKKGAFVIC
jgi:hypothetical protein